MARSDERPEQSAGAADHGLHDQLARRIEGECLGRHVALQDAEQAAGETGIGRGNREYRQLVPLDVVPDRSGALRIVTDCREDVAER